MTPEEFSKIGNFVASLWPMAALTDEQASVWRETLSQLSYDRVRKAVSIAYSRSTWREPQLGSVTQIIQELRKVDVPVAIPELPEEKRLEIYEHDRKVREEYYRKHGVAMAPAGTVNGNDLIGKKKGKVQP